MISAGWHRLWLLVTILLVGFGVWHTSQNPNVSHLTGSTWYCIPGTYLSSVEEYDDGYIEPTQGQVSAEAERRGIDLNEPMAELALKHSLQVQKTKNVKVFSCSSYWSLISSFLIALLTSLGVAGVFLAIRWVCLGFNRIN